MSTEMNNKYDEIYKKLCELCDKGEYKSLLLTLTEEETKKIIPYVNDCEKSVENDIKSKMIELGITKAYATIYWARAIAKFGIPKVELCTSDEILMPKEYPELPISEESSFYTPKAHKCDAKNLVLIGAGGVALMAAIFVPGLREYIGWRIVLGGIGLAAIGFGVNNIIKSEEPLIKLDEQDIKYENDQIKKKIKEMCDAQCKLNTNNLIEWTDNVEKFITDLVKDL